MNESIIEPKMADSHELISKPGIRPAQIFKIAPLMTKVKSPKVRMLMGKVRKMRKGHKSAFANPISRVANKAVIKPLILKPGVSFDVSKTAKPETSQCKIKCVVGCSILNL